MQMQWNARCVGLALAVVLFATPDISYSESNASNEDSSVGVSITGELGFLDVLSHRIQFGRNGTYIDYVDEGGQDVLFAFQRLSAEFEFSERHHAIFLYQPLSLDSQVVLDRDIRVDGLVFPEGTAVDMRYRFPFYRVSYLYDLAPSADREIAVGGSLQLRNATINFTSVDGSLRRAERNVGPVPIVKVRTHFPLGGAYWFEFESDGFYAPISYLNGDDNDVVGAILDGSVRAGRELTPRIGGFVNLRYFGGGSVGENPDDDGPGDGYTRNWLHFAIVSLGFTWGTANEPR